MSTYALNDDELAVLREEIERDTLGEVLGAVSGRMGTTMVFNKTEPRLLTSSEPLAKKKSFYPSRLVSVERCGPFRESSWPAGFDAPLEELLI